MRFSFIILAMVFFSCSDAERTIIVDNSVAQYYQDTYAACRDRFVTLSSQMKNRFNRVEMGSVPVLSRVDRDLYIDYCYIPAQKQQRRLFIMTSGVHGLEGFAGSAIQQMFINEILRNLSLADTGILLIHGVNPYGMKHYRRVSENNVDLNRNFDTNKKLFTEKNPGYTALDAFLNPKEKVDLGRMSDLWFKVRAIVQVLRKSTKALRQAIVKGQYEIPQGLYYGGKDFEQQRWIMDRILWPRMRQYRSVMLADLHTGYGDRYKLHLFPSPTDDKKRRESIETIFNGYRIEWASNTGDFYVNLGDFGDYVGKLVPGLLVVPMCFEFGTVNNISTMGSMTSLQTMLLENQGFYYGYESPDVEKKVQSRVRAMYYPASLEWRSEVIRSSREMLPVILKRFDSLAAQ